MLFRSQIDLGTTYANENSNNNMLFFNDFDADGNNEFIILGYYVNDGDTSFLIKNTMVQPLSSSPYFYEFPVENNNISFGDNIRDSSNTESDIQKLNICQIGFTSSPMEICYLVSLERDFSGWKWYGAVGFITDTSDYFNQLAGTSEAHSIVPFTYDTDNDGKLEFCYGTDTDNIICRDLNESIISSFASNKDLYFLGSNSLEVIVTELDGNTSTQEIVYSNGEIESSNWLLAQNLDDWASTFNNNYNGELMVQDISADDKNELIYIDDTFLRIYSNDNTPFVFMNLTEEQDLVNGSTTTTTLLGGGAVVTTPTEFMDRIQGNILTIIGLFIVIAMVVMVAMMGVSNPVVLMFVAIVGAILVTMLGLLSGTVLILLLVGLVILIILGLTILSGDKGK